MNEITQLDKFENVGLVLFTADWCGPCKVTKARLYPMLENELQSIGYQEINVDENPTIAGQYGIFSIPTMILFDGEEVITASNSLDTILSSMPTSVEA